MTQKELKEKFVYENGTLRRFGRGRGVGKKTGRVKSTGYHSIKIHGREYFTHRLVWLWHSGEWPNEIDHIDRNKLNNSIENLRDVTHQENANNRKDFIWKAEAMIYTRGAKFAAYAKWGNGKAVYLGVFVNYMDALRCRIMHMREHSTAEGHA